MKRDLSDFFDLEKSMDNEDEMMNLWLVAQAQHIENLVDRIQTLGSRLD